MPPLRWLGCLVVVFVMIVALLGCWSTKNRGPGTNLPSSGSNDGPWNQGGASPALTQP